ncbi:MAG: EAL domain-containing protein [Gammaproteobacteria bacterium]
MLPFRSYPISRKLILVSMISTASALVLASAALIIYDIITTKESIKNELSILTTVIGDNSSAALFFLDEQRANDNLAALKTQQSIVSACLYTDDGSVFATYSRGLNNKNTCQPIKLDNINRNKDDIQFSESKIHQPDLFLSQPIFFDGELIGAISILYDTSNIQIRIYEYIAIVTIIFLITVGAAFLLSSRLQRVISVPINQLVKTAKHISEHNDYSTRAVKYNEDELGLLVDTFNNMLEKIEEQNVAVVATKERYRIMYDDNPAMLFTTDIDGKVLSINQFGAKQSGYTFDELVGHSLLDIIHDEDKEIVLENIKISPSQQEEIHNLKIRLVHKNGSILWVKNITRSITSDDGKKTILIMCENITEEQILAEQLNFHASHDALTGLVNRREFEQRAERLLSTVRQEQGEHALCFMDLDQFKVVNDTCGHTAGDELLRQLSSLLEQNVRHRDTLARLGGDEFGVLMEHCSLDGALRVATSLQNAIQDYQFSWEGHTFKVGVSMGLVPITETTANLTELLKQADAACYIAKDKGRNRIHVHHADDSELAQRHGEMQWVTRLHQALEEDRFCLYAQTIVPLDGSTDKHYELLIRMVDAKGEIIPPGAFLPAAERYDLISKIDRWVIDNAFGLLADNPVFLSQINFISINLSGQSLTSPGILEFIITQLDESGIGGEKICFEVTETAAISNLSGAVKFISTLRGLGCRFALDDFGSGLSSFGYLKNLPVDYLKIDGMFVKDIVDDPIDRAMVKSINDIGHVMGMKTIAEFVENDEIKGMLRLIGVNYAQGYGIGKPQPFDELLDRSNNIIEINNTKKNN